MLTISSLTANLMANNRAASSLPGNKQSTSVDSDEEFNFFHQGPLQKKYKYDPKQFDRSLKNVEDKTNLKFIDYATLPSLVLGSDNLSGDLKSTKLPTSVIRVPSTASAGLKSPTKSINNLFQTRKLNGKVPSTAQINYNRSRLTGNSMPSDRLAVDHQFAPKLKPKLITANSSIMMASANQSGCSTKPLVINHTSSVDRITNQSEISIIPTLSSQLIFSSIITTQAKTLPSSAQQVHSPSSSFSTSTTATSSSGSSPSKSTNTNISNGTSNNSNNKSHSGRSTISSNEPDLKSASSKQTSTPVGFAAASSTGHVVTAKLMDMGKRLLDAAREGSVEQVRQLVVDSGAPFTSDWLGTTALHLAAQNGHAEIAEILLKGGVNRDARTKLERTALHLAAQGGCLEVVDLLLIHGSDVNARDMLKMTPLHWAVERGHVCVVEKLLFSGADVTARSKFQLTPIDIAQDSDCREMLELFKSWTNKNENLTTSGDAGCGFSESHGMLDVDYHLAFDTDNATTSRASMLDIDEPCIDLVELEWNTLKFEPDFFLSNDDEDEPKVEYLMKIVEELQKENRQLRRRVEQLSTTCQ